MVSEHAVVVAGDRDGSATLCSTFCHCPQAVATWWSMDKDKDEKIKGNHVYLFVLIVSISMLVFSLLSQIDVYSMSK